MSQILICEDQDSIRKMIAALVKARGHDVLVAENGAQALELTQRAAPDLLLLDLTMPGEFDGFYVCERLRATPQSQSMPIIIISALDDAASKERAEAAGADAFFVKPFSPTELLRKITELLAP